MSSSYSVDNPDSMGATSEAEYAQRLAQLEVKGIRRFVDVQAPYRWNLRRLGLGRTLDVGCGLGRNLKNLGEDAVGVDHNKQSVEHARSLGLTAFTVDEFEKSEHCASDRFDSLLLAHVLEHMPYDDMVSIMEQYLQYVRPSGKVVVICPQESGYRTDPTHIQWVDFEVIERLMDDVGLRPERQFSFPFARPVGKVFPYNEFCVVATKP